MAKLSTDSPTSRRIVRAFLDFLNSVEAAPGVDLEGLEVSRDCLEQVFKVDSLTDDDRTKPDSLVDIFSSLGTTNRRETETDLPNEPMPVEAPSSSSVMKDLSEEPKSRDEDSTIKAEAFGVSKDELFGQFVAALEKIRFIRTMPDGSDDPVGIEKATRLFHDAITEMEKSGCLEYSTRTLAETLKAQGNKAMQSKLFLEAIEFYDCAIALSENSAVYFCNRAAALTRVHKYNEAIRDCLKSIEIDPNYSKAYSRLGTAYFSQGNYSDALNKGFRRALELDPNNEVVKESIQMAEQRLREDQHRAGRDRSASSSRRTDSEHHSQSTEGSRSQNAPPPFGPLPFNTSGLPGDFASMIRNVAANVYQGQQHQYSQNRNDETGGPDEPGMHFGGNINLTFGDQMPQDLTGTLRSVMEMFSQGNSSQETNGRSSAPPS